MRLKLLFACLLVSFSFAKTFASNGKVAEKLIDEDVKKEAGIYAIHMTISEELTTEGSLGRVSWSKDLSDEQKKLIIKMIESKCSDKLNVNAVCIYKKNKKGKVLTSIGTGGSVSGMPGNTFKNAVQNNTKDIYIKLDLYITNDGKPIMVDGKKSVIKPKVTAYIKAFDKDKNVVFENKLSKKSLEGIITLTNKKEPLSPNNSCIIFEHMVTELLKD